MSESDRFQQDNHPVTIKERSICPRQLQLTVICELENDVEENIVQSRNNFVLLREQIFESLFTLFSP